MALVSVDEFATRVNLDLDPNGQDDRLPNVQAVLNEAQDAVFDYIKTLPDPMWDESTIPFRVKSAIMLVAKDLLDGGTDMISGLGTGDPKCAAVALVYRLRDPALA